MIYAFISWKENLKSKAKNAKKIEILVYEIYPKIGKSWIICERSWIY